MKELIELLKKNNLTIASCESLTGGLFASMIVSIPGASKVFAGSYVTYQNLAKEKILDGKEILEKYGAISANMALLMAKRAKNDFNSDIAISFTGNAGPSADEGKPVGLTYMCLIIKDRIFDYCFTFKGDRAEIRNACVNMAIKLIKENISNF